VIAALKTSIGFMLPGERTKFYALVLLRAFSSLLDLAGILAIGFLATSVALFLTEGSDPNRVITIGDFELTAVNAQSLPLLSGLILVLFIAKALISIVLSLALARFLARVEARASRDVARSAFLNGLDRVRLHSRDEVLFASLAGSPSAFNGMLNSLGVIASEGFLFALVIISFAVINAPAALAAIVYFGLIGFVIQKYVGKKLEKTSQEINREAVNSSSSLLDLGEVYRESSILGRSDFFITRLYESRLRSAGNTALQIVLATIPRYLIETSLLVALAIFVVVQSLSGDLASSAATIGVFLSGGLRLTAALLPLQGAVLALRQAVPAAQKAFDILLLPAIRESTPRAPESPASPIAKNENPLPVRLTEVSFSYGSRGKETISDVSLEISAGAQVAFIGLSGAGKSTVADLILGLLTPTSGEVLVGGQKPSHLIRSNPGLLSYVPQRPGLVSGTIAENIALGIDQSKLDQDLLRKAVSDSHLQELIESLPEGLETDLGKRRDALSGGQIQRIGLARALYSQPRLLILDEATSSLDAESENEISMVLDEMRKKVTVILIAHRLNSIQHADAVFFMEAGRVMATGTFSELEATNETVRNLADLMKIKSRDNKNPNKT
jgi:ATP-binding cassette, subfamily B, bacterial PglK